MSNDGVDDVTSGRSNKNNGKGEAQLTETRYNRDLRLQAMYKVLSDYGSLLRPALYTVDSRFVLLAAMCTMIDHSKSLGSRGAGDTESATDLAPEWRLDDLAAELTDEKKEESATNDVAAATAALTADQRLTLLERYVADSPFL